MVLLPARALKNAGHVALLTSMIFYTMAKALDTMGVFKAIRRAGTVGTKIKYPVASCRVFDSVGSRQSQARLTFTGCFCENNELRACSVDEVTVQAF